MFYFLEQKIEIVYLHIGTYISRNYNIAIMGNIIDSIFMESYVPNKNMEAIKCTIESGKSSTNNETKEIYKKILDIVPSKRNFIIKNNIAISTSTNDYVENNIPIFKLICIEGLNNCHRISLNREQHLLIAKVNLYTSTTMY